MPLSTATITFDISDQLGVDYDRRRDIRAWVDTNIPNDTIVDGDGNKVRVGTGKVTIGDGGTGSFTVWTPGTGSNPASWQTSLHVEYIPSGNSKQGRQVRTFGPFTITGNADLADLIEEQEVPPEYAGQVVAQMQTLLAQTEAASGVEDTDTAVAYAVGFGDETAEALAAKIAAQEARPTWAAGPSKRFNPERGWYNVNPTSLSRWIKARMKMQAGTKQAHIAVLGDSTWHATSVNPSHTNSTPGKIKSKLMTQLGVASGGTGIVVPWNTYEQAGNGSWTNPIEPRLKFYRDTPGGGFLQFSPGGEGMYTTGAVAINDPGSQTNAIFFQPGFAYDELWVYSVESGSQSVIADMGAGTNVPADTSAYYSIRANSASSATPLIGTGITPLTGYQRDTTGGGGQRVAKITLTNGTHNFRLMDDLGMGGGGTTYYVGVEARINNTGLRVSNLAQSGRALENLWQGGNDTAGTAGYILGTDMAKADLTIIGLMLNDYQASIPVATYKERLRQTVIRAKATGATGTYGNGVGAGADVLLVVSAQPDADWPPIAPSTTYTDYMRAAYEVADEFDVGLIDTAYRWVDYSTSSAFMSDDVHPNVFGTEDIANNIVGALTSF